MVNFNSDFGDNIWAQFTVGYLLPVPEITAPITSFSVYPNPTSGLVTAQLSMPLQSTVKLKLMNMLGAMVREESLTVTQETEKFVIDGSNLPEGIYYLTAESGTHRETRKVVITR